MKKTLYFIILVLFLGNIYMIYSYSKLKETFDSSQKELESIPYFMTMEQVENLRLFILKPELFKAKLYAEAGVFFQKIEKANQNIHLKVSCISWDDNSKDIFYNLFKAKKYVYKLDSEYEDILRGIDFFDTLCRHKKRGDRKIGIDVR